MSDSVSGSNEVEVCIDVKALQKMIAPIRPPLELGSHQPLMVRSDVLITIPREHTLRLMLSAQEYGECR